MGLLVSRFRRKKTTFQVLEELEKRIRSIEQYGHSTEQQRRRVIGSLVVFSIGLYVLTVILYYFYLQSKSWRDIILYVTPLLLFPVLVILLRGALTRYYEWKLKSNKSQLINMRSEKKKILEDVMETEKYKYAKEILDKFGDKNHDYNPNSALSPLIGLNTPVKTLVPSTTATPNQLRQRQVVPVARTSIHNNSGILSNLPKLDSSNSSNQMTPVRLQPNKLPRPILSTGGGAFDRLVDYLVGDGAGSRFALICSQCMGHNGMALPEEFEFLSYRCAYCHFLNVAKKQKPKAPPLLTTPVRVRSSTNDTPAISSNTDSDESIDEKMDTQDTKEENNVTSPVDLPTSSDTSDNDNHVAQGESKSTD